MALTLLTALEDFIAAWRRRQWACIPFDDNKYVRHVEIDTTAFKALQEDLCREAAVGGERS
jgi:hypothetical protein